LAWLLPLKLSLFAFLITPLEKWLESAAGLKQIADTQIAATPKVLLKS